MKINAKEIIVKCGGRDAVAKQVGLSREAVRKWEVFGVIPECRWAVVMKMYGRKLTPGFLHKMNEQIRAEKTK